MPIILLHKQQGNVARKFKNVQVRSGRLKEWLVFLIEHNPLFIEHTTDEVSLKELPNYGLVLKMLHVYDKDKNSMNGNISIVCSQETETDKLPGKSKISRGPEQGGLTGTNLLVKESYSEPSNLNNEEGEDSRIKNILRSHVEGTKENIIPGSAQSEFLNDYCIPALECVTSPTLFMQGNGIWFNQERRVEVTFFLNTMSTC